MEKKGTKGRTIKYSSIKNDEIMIVHSQEAKHYADCLEQIDEVLKYETLKELDNSLFSKVNPNSIRKDYFDINWLTDFVIYYTNGDIGVRELVTQESLYKLATIEKLELSRRYWELLKVKDWKIIIVKDVR